MEAALGALAGTGAGAAGAAGAALGTAGAAAAGPVGWGMIAAQAIPEIYKLFTAGKQKRMANKYAKTPRPAYEIPQALKDYLAQTKFNAAVSGLPGQAQLENKLQRQQASAIARSAQSQGSAAERDITAAAGDFATKSALGDTAYDAARYKAARQQDYYNAETAMAKQQLAQWEWDKKSPYIDAMAAASALNQAANENAMTGIEGLMGTFQTAGNALLLQQAQKKLQKQAAEAAGDSITDAISGAGLAGEAAGAELGGIAGRMPATTPNWAELNMPFPNMQLSPIGNKPELTGSLEMEEEYGPGLRRAIRRAGGETSQFNINVPDEITNNWANNYFGMEMPASYGYGQTWNDIMNRIATQYGLGDMYGEETKGGVDRLYSRFNPFR